MLPKKWDGLHLYRYIVPPQFVSSLLVPCLPFVSAMHGNNSLPFHFAYDITPLDNIYFFHRSYTHRTRDVAVYIYTRIYISPYLPGVFDASCIYIDGYNRLCNQYFYFISTKYFLRLMSTNASEPHKTSFTRIQTLIHTRRKRQSRGNKSLS